MSNTTALPPIPADIAATTAPQMFGILINWMLYGVLSVQAYVYYNNFPDDKLWNKVIVYTAFIIESTQTAMCAADLYFWYGTGFGNLNHLGNVNVSPVDTPLLCAMVAAIVQCFFAFRIVTLRRSFLWIAVLIVLLSILQMGGGIAGAIMALKLQEYAKFHSSWVITRTIYIWLLGDTVCDVLVAVTMLWLFYITRNEGTKHASRILGKLVRLIVETNTLTAGMAIVSVLLYVILPNSPLYICMNVIMGKLYTNTLLVTFNNRLALRNDTVYKSDGIVNPTMLPSNGFNSDISTFHVASDSFGGNSVALESFEFSNEKEIKARG